MNTTFRKSYFKGPGMPLLNSGNWDPALHPRDSDGEFRYNGGRHRKSSSAGSSTPSRGGVQKLPRIWQALFAMKLGQMANAPGANHTAPITVTASEFAGGNERGHMRSAYDGTQVNPDALGVALPARVPPGTMVRVTNPATGQSVVCPVRDRGPHNLNDPYWNHPGQRPAAEAQYANGVPAQNGDVPGNPAGSDLTPATMNALGIRGAENTRQARVIIQVIPPPSAPTDARRR